MDSIVRIEIHNGVAEVIEKSKGIKLVITDYDAAELEDDDNLVPATEEYEVNEEI